MNNESAEPEAGAPQVLDSPAPAAPLPPPPTVAYEPPHQASFTPAARQRPLLGPVYWTYGAVLWSYVVLGQYTTDVAPWTSRDVPLGGGTAALLFMLCGALALWRSIVATSTAPSRFSSTKRALLTFVVTLVLWGFTLLVVCGLAAISSSNPDVALKLFLFVIALVALFFGRRWSRPHGPKRPPEQRALVIALWVGALLATIPALFHE